MPARSIAKGTLSFGLVTVPIQLYSAAESSAAVSFNLLHDTCHTRLKQQYVCPKDGEIVTRDRMVKGYEFAKDQYVAFTEDELKTMQEQASRAIEITEFVPAAKVDPIYFDTPYYLGPDKGGERAYRLLAEAMRQTGRSALAKWAARGKMYLVLIRAIEGGMVMQALHYADEVRPFTEVGVEPGDVKDAELDLATKLIEQIATEEFRPDRYEDEVKKRYHEAIQRKVDGQEVTTAAPEQPRAQIIDLMEALKASLGQKAAPVPAAQEEAAAEERRAGKRAPKEEARARPQPKVAGAGRRR
jgi:DNA end-binding protein Ku